MNITVMRERELEGAELQRRVDFRNVDLAPRHSQSQPMSSLASETD